MNPAEWFGWAGKLAMVGWVMLIFLPRGGNLLWAVLFNLPRYVIPFVLGLLYAVLVLTNFHAAEGGFGSLDQVRLMFGNDWVLLAGWVHYLAFDLFIGAWIARHADLLGVPRLIQAVLLVLTFMLGPLGLVSFLALRAFYQRSEVAAT